MAGAKPKYQATVKAYGESGIKMEIQGTRLFALRGIWNMMTPAERATTAEMVAGEHAKDKDHG